MTRDEAVKIAADALRRPVDVVSWTEWAASVVEGADALLAAMGEPKPRCVHDCCCAATEARVVAEIANWCRKSSMRATATEIERGDWRAKENQR